ncbi:MAG: hypothetical protein KJ698_09195 [Actinobacteria bacterium]|nr:hypothetical protein [Actinomycetota bacterium]MBU1493374.1 hypothetical protein [Actinomycetota bacterium]
MSVEFEIVGGAGPRETAAIMAALLRLAEEQMWASSVPDPRPGQGSWVLSGRPAPVGNPFLHRQMPVSMGWSLGGEPVA